MSITETDFAVLDFIQSNMRTGFGDAVMPLITMLGNSGILWIVFCIVLICIPKFRRQGFVLFTTLGVNFVIYQFLLKGLIQRPRPFVQNPDMLADLLIRAPRDSSFPSGHTSSALCITAALFYMRDRMKPVSWIWIPALAVSVLIAFSRLYLYVHFPSDVLAGAVIGVFSGWFIPFLFYRVIARKEDSVRPCRPE